ncbi:MAG: 23S rRNA (cytosine(1962)-C(5))-methyltransferase RlmI, partial [Chloroflexota bacterium]
MPALVLKPGRERSLLRRHPWIFSGAVDRVDGNPAAGGTVDLLSSKGDFLARAAYSPLSQIRARAWTFDPVEAVDADFFRRRLHSSLATRHTLNVSRDTDALRLVHAESDGLPGLIVDRYADTLVVQFLAAGAEYWRKTIADLLLELTGLKDIYERSDADVRELEGLPPRVGSLRGALHETRITIHENGPEFLVNIATGHKTGFYLDQRQNRLRVRQLADGREVLDCFCYT